MDFWRWAYLALGAAISAVLIVQVARNVVRVSRKVREFREEVAARQGPPPDPFQALAEIYAERERLDREARARRKKG